MGKIVVVRFFFCRVYDLYKGENYLALEIGRALLYDL